MRQKEIRIATTECLYNKDNGNSKGKNLSHTCICFLLLSQKTVNAYHSIKEMKEKNWGKHDREIESR